VNYHIEVYQQKVASLAWEEGMTEATVIEIEGTQDKEGWVVEGSFSH